MPRVGAGSAATPLLRGELLKCSIVGCVALGRQTLRVKKIVDVFGEDGADGMDRFVPRETGFHQALQCRANNRLILQGQLVLHDRMDRRVKQSRPSGQADSCVPVMVLNKDEPFALLEREPLPRIGSDFRVVALHHPITRLLRLTLRLTGWRTSAATEPVRVEAVVRCTCVEKVNVLRAQLGVLLSFG